MILLRERDETSWWRIRIFFCKKKKKNGARKWSQLGLLNYSCEFLLQKIESFSVFVSQCLREKVGNVGDQVSLSVIAVVLQTEVKGFISLRLCFLRA